MSPAPTNVTLADPMLAGDALYRGEAWLSRSGVLATSNDERKAQSEERYSAHPGPVDQPGGGHDRPP
jgi:hypothetical protein